MEKIKTKKNLQKIASLLLATGLWFYVSAQGTTTIKKTVKDVTVTISGETALHENGFSVVRDGDLTVNVSVSGANSTVRRINRGSLTANVNVSSINKAGTHKLPVTISPTSNTTATFNVRDYVEVKIEPLATKKFDILNENIRSPKDTSIYLKDTTFSRKTVTVSAGESVIKKIESIKTEPLDIKKNEKEYTARLIAYGQNGEEIHDGVSLDPKEITVTCALYPVKTLPIVLVTTEGKVIELPKSNTIRISGIDIAFDETTEIRTEPINLALFKPGDTTTLNLIIPDGIILPDNASEITLEIKDVFYK